VQAVSGSESDSDSRRKECPLFNSAGAYSGGRLWRVGLDSWSSDSDCDSVAFSENDNEDHRFTQYGIHDENQDDGEVISQRRSLVSTRQSTEEKAEWSKR